MLTLIRIALLVGMANSLSHAGDWPEFRGPTGQGISDASDVPTTWSDTENIVWKVAVPGIGWSSPVVAEDRIFLTTAVEKDAAGSVGQSLRVICLDAETGETVWNVEAFDQRDDGTVQKHKKNSHASATPVVEGDRVYVHFGPHGTACLQTDNGEILWKKEELKYAPTHGNGGSPAIAGDNLVICCDGSDVQFVAGLDKRTGKLAWKTERGLDAKKGFSFSTPLVIDVQGRQQAICPASGGVFAYDPQTGEELWRVRYGDGYSVVPRPVAGLGLLFVCTGYESANLLAIDPTGAGDVTDTHVKWKLTRGIPKSPSLLLVDTELYFVDDKGVASCVNAQTGEVYWQERLGGAFSASPLFAAGNVYFQDEEGSATVVRAAREYQEVSRNNLSTGERTYASYAVHSCALLLRSEHHLYRIEAARVR